jgi:omega-6 fatty acid desaturase (delta-12 desaturase)
LAGGALDADQYAASTARRRRRARALRLYRQANRVRSARELAVTSIGFVLLAYSMLWAVEKQILSLYAVLLLPAASLLVRLFMIQHAERGAAICKGGESY